MHSTRQQQRPQARCGARPLLLLHRSRPRRLAATASSSRPRRVAATASSSSSSGPVKCFVFVRHGHSTWNEQGRIQGNTDESQLTQAGREQAACARAALTGIRFDSCFSSPHTRARQTAEVVWQPWLFGAPPAGQRPLFLPSLAEVDLGWFQGLRNEDIARDHPELYRVWREEPEHFQLDGRFPVHDAFAQAHRAWADMLSAPGRTHLVVTHKSLLRALLCTAMGLQPRQFRCIDIANGAVCMVRSNARGDLMLSALNLTSHLHHEGVQYRLPGAVSNDALVGAAPSAAAELSVARGSSSSSSCDGASSNGTGGQ